MKGKACYLSFSLDELIVLNDRQEVKDKKTIITLFLARFILNEAEVEALTSRDIPIGQRFLDAMDKMEHKIVVCLWRVRMDQQKPGVFHHYVFLFIAIFFEGWKSWPPLPRI